jgi:hypothetical protein
MRSFFVSPPGFCFADNFQYAVIFFSPPGFYFADTFFLQLRKIVRNQEAAADILRLSGDDGRKRLNRTEQKQIKKNSGFIFQITYLTEVS